MRGVGALVALVSFGVALGVAEAAPAEVAVAPFVGPAKSGVRKLEGALLDALEAEGVVVRRVEGRAAARGAMFLAGTVEAADHGFVATLIIARAGRPDETRRFRYEGERGALSAGRELAAGVLELVGEGGGGDEELPAGEADEPAAEAPPKAAEPKPTPPPEPTAKPTPPPEPAAGPDSGSTPAPETTPAEPAPSTFARPWAALQLGAGSQAFSAYGLTVGDRSTGLAYRVDPLLLVALELEGRIPSTPLELGLGVGFAPVRFALATDPATSPAEPSGRFLAVRARFGASFRVAAVAGGELALGPVLDLWFEDLDVEAQAPFDLVLASSLIAPGVGLFVRLATPSFEIAARAAGRLAIYGERPAGATGEAGLGGGVSVAGQARYFVWPFLGVGLDLGYDFAQIGHAGEGTRDRFEGDPPLVDATAHLGRFWVTLGVVLAWPAEGG